MSSNIITMIVAVVGIAGTLGGVLIGHFLDRSWQKQQWLQDRRKEEFRELITALTKAEVLLVGVANGIKNSDPSSQRLDEYNKAANDAFSTILDRIFIADVIARTPLMAKWADVQTKFLQDQDADAASAKYAEIKAAIIHLALAKK